MGNKNGCFLQKKMLNQQSGIPEEDICIQKVAFSSITSFSFGSSITERTLFLALYLKIIVEHSTLRNNLCASYART